MVNVTEFNENATGRFYVTRNSRITFNGIRQQADVIAKHESERHPRSTVRVVDAATGELAATWVKGEQR